MQVKLNAYRGEHRPGDIVDLLDNDAAVLIAHGAAFPVDDIDVELDKEQRKAGSTVSAKAELTASSGTETDPS